MRKDCEAPKDATRMHGLNMVIENVISDFVNRSRQHNTFAGNSIMSDTRMAPPPIRIIGAGLSGLTLGQCLRRSNIPAVVYERVKANPTRNNYGITLYKSTYKPLLDTLKITEDDFKHEVGVQHPDSGAVVSDNQRLRVNRAALTSLLESNLDIRYEHKLDSISSNDTSRSTSLQTGFEDRTTSDFNLLIAADGVHSAVRSAQDPRLDARLMLLTLMVRFGT